jgi:hypothetical protein
MEIISSIFVFWGCIGVGGFLLFAWAIFRSNSIEYRENRRLTGAFWNPFRGQLKCGPDVAHNPRVQEGLVFNETTQQYESQHALSDEAVRSVLFPRG